MAAYEPEYCAKCTSCPDDILTMNCGHDLCLQCAATTYFRERRKHPDALVCETCQNRTALDQSSIQELARYAIKQSVEPLSSEAPPSFKTPTINAKNAKPAARYAEANRMPTSRQNTARLDNLGTSLPAIPSPKQKGTSLKSDTVYCSEHPQDEILYFCFSCMSRCICPECVIHGAHKNHDAKTIKRALPQIKQRIFEVAECLEKTVHQIDQQCAEQSKHLHFLNDKVSTTKRAIKQSFDLLRKSVSEQEERCISKCQQYLQENRQLFERTLESLGQQKDKLVQEMHQINELLKAPEVKLLNRYVADVSRLNELKRVRIMEVVEPTSDLDSQEISSAIQDILAQTSELQRIDPRMSNSSVRMAGIRREQPRQSKIVSTRIKGQYDTLPISLIGSSRKKQA